MLLAAVIGSSIAFSQEQFRRDRGVSYLGFITDHSISTGMNDMDFLLGQKLRWHVFKENSFRSQLLLNARLIFDPQGEIQWERNRIRSLGIKFSNSKWTFDIGRHNVYYGGPRIVDGAQVVYQASQYIQYGGWFGFSPDLFTTNFQTRSGGGPIFVYTQKWHQLSIIGEALQYEGQLDRLGMLILGRLAADPLLEVHTRVDLQYSETLAGSLADVAINGRLQATNQLRLFGSYEAYSSLRYLQTTILDPTLQRFHQGIQDLELHPGVQEDMVDDSLYHLLGGTLEWNTYHPSVDTKFQFGANGRYRFHPEVDRRFLRIFPWVAYQNIGDLPLMIRLDGNMLWHESNLRGDIGLGWVYQLSEDGDIAFDSSFRILYAPEKYSDKPGFYGDLYIDWVHPTGLVLIVGGYGMHEPANGFNDQSMGGYLRFSWHHRGEKPPISSLIEERR